MSRYLERVENSARLVAVYGELLLDLPEDAGLDWSVALEALGMVDAYQQERDEANELEFLLTDPQNIASVLNSLNFARENARTTRDIVPSEAWHDMTAVARAWRGRGVAGALKRATIAWAIEHGLDRIVVGE